MKTKTQHQLLKQKKCVTVFCFVLFQIICLPFYTQAFIGNAQSGINETFAILYTSGANNIYYDLYANSTNPDFNGANLGTFNCNSTLLFKGGQHKVFKCSGGDITSCEIFYRVYKVGTTPGAFNAVGVGYASEFTNGCGGKDQTWENANSTINLLAGLGAGVYNIEVYSRSGTINNAPTGYWYASNNGNNYTAQFTVAGPTISAFANQALCSNQTGLISFTTSGGLAPVTVKNNGTIVTSPVNNLIGGTYSLVATDANGCTSETVLGIAAIPPPISVLSTVVNPLCNGGGSTINFTINGGTGTVALDWFGMPVPNPWLNVFVYNFAITATDANGCTLATSVLVSEPPALSMTFVAINPNCNGGTGTIVGGASGGTGLLSFSINNNPIVTNYPAGTYTVQVQDANNCTLTQLLIIDNPFPIVASASFPAVQCYGDNATVTVSASGGSGAYTGIGTYTVASNASYTYTVADANNCSATTSVTVTSPSLFAVQFNLANNSTFTSGDVMNLFAFGIGGNIASSVLTGPDGYYSTSNSFSDIVSPIEAGVYSITATNANGCTATSTVQINVITPPNISLAIKAFLDGPYKIANGLMTDSLRKNGFIPVGEPYSSTPYSGLFTHVGTGGGEILGNTVLSVNGANAIVDWVFVQLRSAADSSIVLGTKSALLQCDGDVVDASDGVSQIQLPLGYGNYFISIKHRNHLGVMTKNAIACNAATVTVNFTNANIPLYTNALINTNANPLTGASRVIGGTRLLYAGNCNITGLSKNNITYGSLPISDRLALFTITNGASIPNAYSIYDVDLSGTIFYNGANSDRAVIQKNCLQSASLIIYEQVPN
jgi:hypothetical protein